MSPILYKGATVTLHSAAGQWRVIDVKETPDLGLQFWVSKVDGQPDPIITGFNDIIEARLNIPVETCPDCRSDKKVVGQPCFHGICLRRRLKAVFQNPDLLARVESQLTRAGYETELELR